MMKRFHLSASGSLNRTEFESMSQEVAIHEEWLAGKAGDWTEFNVIQ
jgi:hypothetical protein